jgi:hypothetical protein
MDIVSVDIMNDLLVLESNYFYQWDDIYLDLLPWFSVMSELEPGESFT